MPITNDKWALVFISVRAVHLATLIIILGGHTRICGCNQLDGRSMALESDGYMKTWMAKHGI